MLLSICDNAEILSVFKLVKLVIDIIKIIVPIMLIITMMIDFMQATASNDADALKKATTLAVKKCIAAVCIFFIPNFVNIVINLTSNDNFYKTCLQNATEENITLAYTRQASKLIDVAKDKLNDATYLEAKRAVSKISDPNLKEQYVSELEVVDKVIDAKKLIKIVKKTKNTADYEKAVDAIELIEDEELKKELEEELTKISYTMAAYAAEYSSSGFVQNPLGFPYYNQCDPRWGKIQYDMAGGGSDGGPATLCSSSCGYTSFSMIAAGFNHDMAITPYTVVAYMRAPLPTHRGYGAASQAELTNSKFMAYYNLKAKKISTSKEAIMNEINLNKAVIILVDGHYLVVVPGYTSNKVILLDPFSNWADSRRKSGETTLDNIYSAYNGFYFAASYEPL